MRPIDMLESEMRDRLAAKDAEIARLQEQLEAVAKERNEAKAEVARYWTSADMKPWCDLAESKGLGHFGKKLKGMFSRAMKAEDEARIEFDRAEAAEARAERLEALERAAIIWWRSRRPINGWTEQDHLANPAINCCDVIEGDLARAVAALDVKEAG